MATKPTRSSKQPDKPKASLGQEFLYSLRFKNELPIIPIGPKLLEVVSQDRLYKYSQTSLHQNYQYPIVTDDIENGMGINVLKYFLIKQSGSLERVFYKLPVAKKEIHKDDLILLEKPLDKSKQPIVSRPRPIVPWLRRTEYISADHKQFGRLSGVETKMGQSVLKDESLQRLIPKTRNDRIRHIEDSFEKIAIYNKDYSLLKHPTNPSLKVTEMIPFLPDFENWPNVFLLGAFDEDPLGKIDDDTNHDLKLESAMMKIGSDNTMSFYAASDETIPKIESKYQRLLNNEELDDGGEYEITYKYEFKRDFQYTLAATSKHENSRNNRFFIEKGKHSVNYKILDHKVTLAKKRKKNRKTGYDSEEERLLEASRYDLINYRIRDENEKEIRDRLQRHKKILSDIEWRRGLQEAGLDPLEEEEDFGDRPEEHEKSDQAFSQVDDEF